MITIVLVCLCSLLQANTWKLPNAKIRYNHISFLTSHNSYAAKRHGFFYAQQYLTLEEQLAYGVRGLMLDTYYNFNKTDIDLCHGGLFINRLLRKGRPPMPLAEALHVIKNFLENNPQEILTIFLENYVDDKCLMDSTFIKAKLKDFMLTEQDWNPQSKGKWPKLEWMQKHNKRLVVFNSISKTDLTFYQWHHVVENQYGALVPQLAAQERKESQLHRYNDRYLYLVNYFSTFKLSFGNAYKAINSIHLKALMNEIYQGLGQEKIYKMRFPNFIALDYIHEGDGLYYINLFNRIAQSSSFRKSMFNTLRYALQKA